MKKNLLIIVLFLNASILMSQDWSRYKYEELGFIADFPSVPEKNVQKVDTEVGQLDMHMIMVSKKEGEDDNFVYLLVRSDYPKSQFINATKEYNKEVLDGAIAGAVKNIKGKILYDKTVRFNGYPGRVTKIKIDGGYLYLNCYLVDNIMFICEVICPVSKDNNKSISRFMDSFEIIKTKN
ncbi:hypothetical protein MC378_04610 [Polaribacter sp. MSW13]|uniref:Uncharacterized protein n=1 Tax=Polaribacter marinus TaxID=2916838 RepID=A0A9X1VL01_9FLAO|nr:hypothetical protein [Polaribacter marinus]MCI2228439.1 hypothetical protein [Polaribacter marinus]